MKTIKAHDAHGARTGHRAYARLLSRGQTIVMLALMIPILLGAIALGTDVAVFYYNWAQLQRAADAAALAGASYLPRSTNGATSAAIQYAALNGVPSGQVSSVTFGSSNTTVTVRMQRSVPYIFAHALGLVNNPVHASATAAVVNAISVTDAMPIGLDSQTTYTNGQTIVMHQGGLAPGNWGGLALGCTGANCFRDNLQNGYDGTLTVGQVLQSEPGATTGPTTQGINARLQAGVAFDSSATYQTFQPGDPRAVVVPIVNWAGCTGSCNVPIIAFATVWLNSVSGTNINATFISMVVPGSTGGTGTDYGSRHATLIQ